MAAIPALGGATRATLAVSPTDLGIIAMVKLVEEISNYKARYFVKDALPNLGNEPSGLAPKVGVVGA